MRFQEFRRTNIVVAAGEGGFDGNPLGFSIDFQLNPGDTIVSSHRVYFRPNGEMNDSFEGINVVKT